MSESALAQWRQWQVELPSKPKIVRSLGQGLSNQSYLLKAGEVRMVLRINSYAEESKTEENTAEALPGINRQREAVIWRSAHEAGLAPPLLHAENQYLVSQFVADETFSPNQSGKDWTRQDLTQDDLADEAFRVIEKCHAIKIDTDDIDYARHIQTYWDILDRSGHPVSTTLIEQRHTMQASLNVLSSMQQEVVLCHHDPVMANFVGTTKRLFLIDWEYAANGMAVMDYAALAVEWGFSDAMICSRTSIRLDSLVMAKNLYRYMCRLWEAAQGERHRAD